MGLNRRTILIFILSVVGIIVIFPVIINTLMFINVFPVSGNKSTWIGALSTFWGAIIGGSISGILTLIGVRYTILFQLKRERLGKLPELINRSWKISKQISFIEGAFYKHKENPDKYDVEFIQRYCEGKEEYVTELSSKVSPRMYDLVLSFFTHVSDYDSYKNKGKLEEWYTKVDEYSKRVIQMIQSLEEEYEDYN